MGTSALWISALFGPSQVFVRFVNMITQRERHPLIATLFSMAMTPLSLLVLLLTAPAIAGAVAFAVLFGFNSGLKSIVQGTLPLALFGTSSYATRLGIMASVRQILAAVAPFALAWATAQLGAAYALSALTAIAFGALIIFAAIARLCKHASIQ
jgi:hypothetical protein